MGSEWGDVLFAAEEYYRPRVRKQVDPAYWPVMKRWIARVDNWCHSDGLSGTYSRLLEADPASVMPVLERWNKDEALWPRRVSIVSLIHYSGKNAVFLTPGGNPRLPRNECHKNRPVRLHPCDRTHGCRDS